MARDDRSLETQFVEWCFAMFIAPLIFCGIIWIICQIVLRIIGE